MNLRFIDSEGRVTPIPSLEYIEALEKVVDAADALFTTRHIAGYSPDQERELYQALIALRRFQE